MKSWIHIAGLRLRSLFRSGRSRRELDQEIAFHIDMLTEQRVAQGMSPAQARTAALREFGHVEGVREACKETWGVRLLEEFCMDLRDAFRQALKHPGHTLAIVLTLGICLGSNTTALNFVNKIVAKPYSYADSERIVQVGTRSLKTSQTEINSISIPKYLHLKESCSDFLDIGLLHSEVPFDLQQGNETRRITADMVTPNVWSITGVRPIAGRFFTSSEREQSVIVLSETFLNAIGQDAEAVVGSSLRLDDKSYTVIGVAPGSFHLGYIRSDAWLPRVFETWEREESALGNNSFMAIGRLNPGVSIDQANQLLDRSYESLIEKYPNEKDNQSRYGSTFSCIGINDFITDSLPQISMAFRSVQVVTLIVLSIGCLNVAGMFLLKNYSRVHDLAMRKALGASTSRLARQLTVEVCVYFFLGGLVSLAFLSVGLRAAESLYITKIPWLGRMTIDFESIAATALIALAAALLTSVLPVLSLLRRDLIEFVKTSGRTVTGSAAKHRLHSIFVASQVSLSVILLVVSGILSLNLYETLRKEVGVQREGRIAFEVPQPAYRFASGADGYKSEVLPFQQRALERIRSVPGVVSASASNRVPMSPYQTSHSNFSLNHYNFQPDEPRPNALRVVTLPGYFDTVGTRLVSGRDFSDTDNFDSEKVVIVSRNVVEKYFRDTEPIGSILRFWGQDLRIVGVAEVVQDKPYFINWKGYTLYFPFSQWDNLSREYTTFVAHVQGDVSRAASAIERSLKAMDPKLTVTVTPFEESFEMATFAQRVPMIVSIFFGFLALVLSGLGLYGLISYIVAEKTKELGIRMAFGASPRSILNLVLAGSGKLVALGLSIGLAVSIPFAIKINPLLVDANATSPTIFVAVTLFTAAIALAASLIPARRAMRIDISGTLRV